MKQLIGLIILILLNYTAISRTVYNDTSKTCIANTQLREAARLNEIRKIQAKELEATKQQVHLLEERIEVKDSAIRLFQQKDTLTAKRLSSYDESLSVYKQREAVQAEQVEALKKQVKKEKRKKIINKVVYGTLATIASIVSILCII